MMTGNDLLKSQVLSHWRNIDQVTQMLLFPLAECPSITATMEHLEHLVFFYRFAKCSIQHVCWKVALGIYVENICDCFVVSRKAASTLWSGLNMWTLRAIASADTDPIYFQALRHVYYLFFFRSLPYSVLHSIFCFYLATVGLVDCTV